MKDVEVEHIPNIINPSIIFKKEMKDNTHFRNIRDSMMVSLQAVLKYSYNVLTHIIYAKTILPDYFILSEHILPDSLELKTGVPKHIVPNILELRLGIRHPLIKRSSLHFSWKIGVDGSRVNES